MTTPPPPLLRLDQVRQDGGTQFRTGVSRRAIDQFTEDIRNGDQFPAVVVFFDAEHYWLADGHHRLDAHRAAGKTSIAAIVHQGTQRDAQLFAIGANRANRSVWRTREDAQLAIDRMLYDSEWQTWNDSWISRQVGCSDKTVRSRRAHLESVQEIPKLTELLGEDGKWYPRTRTRDASPSAPVSEIPKLTAAPLDEADLPEDERGDAWEPPTAPAKPTVPTPVAPPPAPAPVPAQHTTISRPPVAEDDLASPAPVVIDDDTTAQPTFSHSQADETCKITETALRKLIKGLGELGLYERFRDSLQDMLDALRQARHRNIA